MNTDFATRWDDAWGPEPVAALEEEKRVEVTLFEGPNVVRLSEARARRLRMAKMRKAA